MKCFPMFYAMRMSLSCFLIMQNSGNNPGKDSITFSFTYKEKKSDYIILKFSRKYSACEIVYTISFMAS